MRRAIASNIYYKLILGLERMARLIGIATIIGIALACVLAEDLYSDRYDDIDVTAIFENEKLRDQYYQCFMDTGPCKTPDARFFKGTSKARRAFSLSTFITFLFHYDEFSTRNKSLFSLISIYLRFSNKRRRKDGFQERTKYRKLKQWQNRRSTINFDA